MPRLTIIIVSFNTKSELAHCLSSVGTDHEVIVVDNASTDGSPEMVAAEHPHAKLIRNEQNVGFGQANNQGLDAMTGEIALLLNSDARPQPGAIGKLLDLMKDGDTVACGGRLAFPDGRTQNSCANKLTLWAVYCEQSLLDKILPSSRLFSPYWLTPRLMRKPGIQFEVAQVMGACLMMRPAERFDEDWFLYCEDTELCHRLRKHGRILWGKEAVFEHDLGASSRAARWEAIARYNRGKEMFFAKHHGKASAALCWIMNRKGAALRLGIWGVPTLLTLGLAPRLRHQASCFLRVLLAPVAGPPDPRDSG